MVVSVKWLLFLTLTGVHAQEPRKRNSNRFSFEEPFLLEQNDDDVSCTSGGCVKRSPGQDEFGPFWANRGKKDPTYTRSKLYAEEPHWILVRRDDKNDNGPFFVARGKKNYDSSPKSVAHLWKNFYGVNALKKKYAQNFDGPYFVDAGRKGNVDKSVDLQ